VAAATIFTLETMDLGWGMDTVLCLYDTDGVTELSCDDDGGLGLASRLRWTPVAPGTYYVRARPYSSSSTTYCDALYKLAIARYTVYLPIVYKSD
jgi:hypothetical protein